MIESCLFLSLVLFWDLKNKKINWSLKEFFFVGICDIKYHIQKVLLNFISSKNSQNYEKFQLYTESIACAIFYIITWHAWKHICYYIDLKSTEFLFISCCFGIMSVSFCFLNLKIIIGRCKKRKKEGKLWTYNIEHWKYNIYKFF